MADELEYAVVLAKRYKQKVLASSCMCAKTAHIHELKEIKVAQESRH